MRTEPHPLPTEPCASLHSSGSSSDYSATPPPSSPAPNSYPCNSKAPVSRCECPQGSPRPPFLHLSPGPPPPPFGLPDPDCWPRSLPTQWHLTRHNGTETRESRGRQAVSSARQQASFSDTPLLLLLPPRPQWGSLDLGGLTAAARARRCCRATSRASACEGRGWGPHRLLWPLSWRWGPCCLPPSLVGSTSCVSHSSFMLSVQLWYPLSSSPPLGRHSYNGPSNSALPLSFSAAWSHSPVSCNYPWTYFIYLIAKPSAFAKRIAHTLSCFK